MADVFAKAKGQRVTIVNTQSKQIKKMYSSIIDDIQENIKFLEHRQNISSVMRVQYLKDLQKQISEALEDIDGRLEKTIKLNMDSVAQEVIKCNQTLLTNMGFPNQLVSGALSYVPKDIVNEIATGKLYEGKWSLSKAIWNDTARTNKDLERIVATGVASQKSTYEIAKDLEKYVNPSAKKGWDWSKVYPGTKKKIDYNAQRLARTMVSHAYEESFVRATKNNPFVECYRWLISNSDRVCPICIGRAENDEYGLGAGLYPKDQLPLDHPNGMCTFEAVITKSYERMADNLADWANGIGDSGLNSQLDEFVRDMNFIPSVVKDAVNAKGITQIEMNFVGCNEYVKSVVPEVLDEYESTFQITPQIKNVVMNEKDFTDLMSSAYAYIKKDDNTTLYLNPSVFESDDKLLSTIGGRIRAYHNNANAKSILAHELSHSIGSEIGDMQYEAVDYAVSNFMSTYTKTAMDFGLPDWQIAGENVSRYSTTTKEEFFAEAFADVYKNKDKAEQISKDVVDYIKRAKK